MGGHVIRARHTIIHEAASQKLGVFVIHDILQQGLAQPLRNAAMNLPQQQHRIHDSAEIIHQAVAGHSHSAGFRVQFHFGHMAAIGEGWARIFRRIAGAAIECAGMLFGELPQTQCGIGGATLEQAVGIVHLITQIGLGKLYAARNQFIGHLQAGCAAPGHGA